MLSWTRLLVLLEQNPCREMAKMEGGEGQKCLCCIFASCCLWYFSLWFPVSYSISLSPLYNHHITPGHLCGPKLMGMPSKRWACCHPLPPFVNIQNTKAKPACGYANVCCPGAAHRDANLWQGPTGYKRGKWSFDSWNLSVWRRE